MVRALGYLLVEPQDFGPRHCSITSFVLSIPCMAQTAMIQVCFFGWADPDLKGVNAVFLGWNDVMRFLTSL